MSQSSVSGIDSSVKKTQIWLNDLTQIGGFQDKEQAYSALRASLHALRDRLTVDEASHLGAELPLVVRGVYFEGWKPAATPTKERDQSAFLNHIQENLGGTDVDPATALNATMKLLDEKISAGELEDVRQMLPSEIRPLAT